MENKDPSLRKRNLFSFGERFTNPYLNTEILEVLNEKKQRVGWLWTMRCGTIIVSPHLGLYIWYGESGQSWTKETGATWLISSRKTRGSSWK